MIPPFWQKAVATNLMKNFFEKTHEQNFSGAAVIAYQKESWWGFFDYMPSWFFQKFGFRQVEGNGNSILMFKNYKDAQSPKFILYQPKSTPEPKKKSERTKAELFWSGQCPYSWWVKKLAEKEFDKTSNIELNFVNTDDRTTVKEFGVNFGLTTNGKIILTECHLGMLKIPPEAGK